MGVLRRDFKWGMVLLNGPDGAMTNIPLPQPYYLLNGALVGNVVLGSKTAVILREVACETPCAADIDGTGEVGILELLGLLSEWSLLGSLYDFDGGGVGITDLLLLLANWGPCP